MSSTWLQSDTTIESSPFCYHNTSSSEPLYSVNNEEGKNKELPTQSDGYGPPYYYQTQHHADDVFHPIHEKGPIPIDRHGPCNFPYTKQEYFEQMSKNIIIFSCFLIFN